MANTATLQQIHLALKELSEGRRSLICVQHLSEHLQQHPEKLKEQLAQLVSLQYLRFTSQQDFVQLTETGLLAKPHTERQRNGVPA